MFIGREKELSLLNKYYKKENFQCIVMHGRRRVGKTKLLTEFVKDKKNVFVSGEEFNQAYTIEKFSLAIKKCFALPESFPDFKTYKDCFDYIIDSIKKNEKLIIVLDEFQYIAKTNKGFLSFLQNYIDHVLQDTNIFLILCGSAVSFMEDEVLAYKSPLFGRRTAQFIIEPLGFYDAVKFFPDYNNNDLISVYSILGGVPQYLLQFSNKLSLKENILENILEPTSYLYLEPREILKQELREAAVYNSIIQAIAGGYTKLNEIATKINEPRDKTAKYISILIGLKIIERITPLCEKKKTHKSYYKIKDNYINFYYRYIYKNSSLIDFEQTEILYKKIKNNISEYIGKIFEDICREYLIKMNKQNKLPFIFEQAGKWWGNNKYKKTEEEIDIIALAGTKAIFCECKYRNEKAGLSILNNLIGKSRLFNITDNYYFIFSKSGFSNELITAAAKDSRIKLINLNKIISLEI